MYVLCHIENTYFPYTSHIRSITGNKCDLESEREVQLSEAEEMRDYVPEIMYVLETSAKENTNIDDIFFCLAAELKVTAVCFMKVG